jgi:hypothetical protein
MVVVKKKVKSTPVKEIESTSTGLKLGKVNVKKVKEKKDSMNKNDNRFFKAPSGSSRLWIIPPTSEAMDGSPYIDTLRHSNLGPDGQGWGMCMRKSIDQPREECLACVEGSKLWDKVRAFKKAGKKDLEEKYVKLASQQSVRIAARVQVLDVTGAYNKKGKVVDEFPKCFGENYNNEEEKYDKCRKCPFLESCQKGVQNWDLPKPALQLMLKKIGDEKIDITDPAKARPLLLKRTGSGRTDTKYVCDSISAPVTIPAHVITFVENHAIDLSTAVKPSTEEQMAKMLSGDDSKKSAPNEGGKKKEEKSAKPDVKKFEKPKISEQQKKEMFAKLQKKSDEKKAKK